MERDTRIAGEKLLKNIRHAATGLYKSLPPKMLISEVERIRDICNEVLQLWGTNKDAR